MSFNDGLKTDIINYSKIYLVGIFAATATVQAQHPVTPQYSQAKPNDRNVRHSQAYVKSFYRSF